MFNKKAQTNNAVMSIIALVAGVGVAVLVLIFVATLGGTTYTLTEPKLVDTNTIVANDTVNLSSSVSRSIGNDYIHPGSVVILNGSDSVTVSTFTIDYDAGTATAPASFSDVILNWSYTHGDNRVNDRVRGGVMSSFEALENTGDYLPIIVIATVIALVMAVVLGMGAVSGKNNGKGGAL